MNLLLDTKRVDITKGDIPSEETVRVFSMERESGGEEEEKEEEGRREEEDGVCHW